MAKRLTEARVTAALDDDGDERFALAKFVVQHGDAWWSPMTGRLIWPGFTDDSKVSIVYERVAGRVTMQARPL